MKGIEAEIKSNSSRLQEQSRLPARQIIRAIACVYLAHILYQGYVLVRDEPDEFEILASLMSTYLCALTSFALLLTYVSHMNRFSGSFVLWAWTHLINSLTLFALMWNLSLYVNLTQKRVEVNLFRFFELKQRSLNENVNPSITEQNQYQWIGGIDESRGRGFQGQEENNEAQLSADTLNHIANLTQFYMRSTVGPAAAIVINFIITDWLLLSRHSLLFCTLALLTYLGYAVQDQVKLGIGFDSSSNPQLSSWFDLWEMGKICMLLCAMHFCQLILCRTQQTFKGFSVKEFTITDYLEGKKREMEERKQIIELQRVQKEKAALAKAQREIASQKKKDSKKKKR